MSIEKATGITSSPDERLCRREPQLPAQQEPPPPPELPLHNQLQQSVSCGNYGPQRRAGGGASEGEHLQVLQEHGTWTTGGESDIQDTALP